MGLFTKKPLAPPGLGVSAARYAKSPRGRKAIRDQGKKAYVARLKKQAAERDKRKREIAAKKKKRRADAAKRRKKAFSSFRGGLKLFKRRRKR